MSTLSDLQGTHWKGTAELWVDPLGNDVENCGCTISIEEGIVRYTWSYQGKSQVGSITLREGAAELTDTWHSPEPMKCRPVPDAWGLFQVLGKYGPQSDWAWRTALSLRTPTDELVLQMTNITPWGEEARAVRMVCQRQP